jgi:hypothetical protein
LVALLRRTGVGFERVSFIRAWFVVAA